MTPRPPLVRVTAGDQEDLVVRIDVRSDVLAEMARLDLPILPARLRSPLIARGCRAELLTAKGLLPMLENGTASPKGEIRIRLE